MWIDILVGVLASLVFIGLIFYFIYNAKKNKGQCSCSNIKKMKKDLLKAKKDIAKNK